jgi:hypothetical protein
MPTCPFLLLLRDLEPMLSRHIFPGFGQPLISWSHRA